MVRTSKIDLGSCHSYTEYSRHTEESNKQKTRKEAICPEGWCTVAKRHLSISNSKLLDKSPMTPTEHPMHNPYPKQRLITQESALHDN